MPQWNTYTNSTSSTTLTTLLASTTASGVRVFDQPRNTPWLAIITSAAGIEMALMWR